MNPRIVAGWLVVPYDGGERVALHISTQPDVWLPAYLDYDNGQRVAKVRADDLTSGMVQVRLRAGTSVTSYRAIRV